MYQAYNGQTGRHRGKTPMGPEQQNNTKNILKSSKIPFYYFYTIQSNDQEKTSTKK